MTTGVPRGHLLAAPAMAEPTPADDDSDWRVPSETELPAPPEPSPRVTVASTVEGEVAEETPASRRRAPPSDVTLLGFGGLIRIASRQRIVATT
jgi:hypothetical protein